VHGNVDVKEEQMNGHGTLGVRVREKNRRIIGMDDAVILKKKRWVEKNNNIERRKD